MYGKSKMKKEKKGIFFTFIAITIMAVFIILFTPQADVSLQKNAQAVTTRTTKIDNYVNDVENSYLPTVLKSSSYKAILSMVLYVKETGSYIEPNKLDSIFFTIMKNGTLTDPRDGKYKSIDAITGKDIMKDNTLIDWFKRINQTAYDSLNVDTRLQINKIEISHKDPWHVDVKLNASLRVISENVAQWDNNNLFVDANISIEGLPDPFYLKETGGAYLNKINKSNITEPADWDVKKVKQHVKHGNYIHWPNSNAPSFLNRLVGSTSASPLFGIESFVNPDKVTPNDQIESYIDYLFFTHQFGSDCAQANAKQLYTVTGDNFQSEYSGFKLDTNNKGRYGIKDNEVEKTCPE